MKFQFRKDAGVLTADGRRIGSIERVVLSPDSRLATHLVVRMGSLLNKTEKVIPMDLVERMAGDEVVLLGEAGDLDKFPLFEEERVIDKKAALDHPPLYGSASPELIGYPEPNISVIPDLGEQYVTQVEQNIPEGTVALREGARVMSADGQVVGHLQRVLADSAHDPVTHLLISRGIFPRESKIIPMDWVTTMTDDEVHLRVEEHWVTELAEVSIAR